MAKPSSRGRAAHAVRSVSQANRDIRVADQVVLRSISDLQLHPHNTRTHSKNQIGQLTASIREFGFTQPILIDEHNTILAGHGRHAAAKRLGMTEVPTICISGLSMAQQRALLLADNKIAANAGWDLELLTEELEALSVELPELEIDVGITGFEPDEIEAMLAAPRKGRPAPDDLPPPPEPLPVSHLGDLWLLGKHRLLHGDARSADGMARLMQGDVAAMILTDPPYNVEVNGHVRGRGKHRFDEFAFASGEMSAKEFTSFLDTCIGNMVHHLRDGGLGYFFMDWRHLPELHAAAMAHFTEQKNLIVWDKRTAGQGSFYRSQHELCAVFKSGDAPHVNNVGLGKHRPTRSNIWSYAGVSGFRQGRAEELAMHPTVKPLAMMADAIIDATRKGETVLDPFLGSGTTLMAAEHTGRQCCSMEYDARYVDVAIRRWQTFTGQEAVLAGDGRTWREVREARRTEAEASAAQPAEPHSPIRPVVPRVRILPPHLRTPAGGGSTQPLDRLQHEAARVSDLPPDSKDTKYG